MKITALIPAYREEKHIREVVAQTRRHVDSVLVVDDASDDNTSDAAQSAGARILRHPVNMGKGAALLNGFKEILKDRTVWAVICLDGDGQHAPEDIPGFLRMAGRKPYPGIVLGTRMNSTQDMPRLRLWTNRVTSAFVSAAAHTRVTDSQVGFRLLRREAVESLNITTTRYDMESEMIIQAAKAGFRIAEVPIQTIYSDEVSSINKFSDTLRFIKLILRYI